MKNSVTIQEVLALLNAITLTDPKAATELINARVPCNEELANHPTIQVGKDDDGQIVVGILGVLNGLFGTDDRGMGPIAVHMLNDDQVNFFDWCKPSHKEIAEERLMTTSDVARYFVVCEATIRRWVNSGDLPCLKIGKSFRFRREDLDEYVSQLQRSVVSEGDCPEPENSL